MVVEGEKFCPICGATLKYYDTVKRLVRTKERKTTRLYIRRLKCVSCNKLHRELPKIIFPFKQYERELIQGVLEKLITPNTLGYEDYPCEATMRLWRINPPTFYSRLGRNNLE